MPYAPATPSRIRLNIPTRGAIHGRAIGDFAALFTGSLIAQFPGNLAPEGNRSRWFDGQSGIRRELESLHAANLRHRRHRCVTVRASSPEDDVSEPTYQGTFFRGALRLHALTVRAALIVSQIVVASGNTQ